MVFFTTFRLFLFPDVIFLKEGFFILQSGSCGGDRHSQQEIIEANIESPEAFVKEKGRLPIIDKIENPDGGVVIVTGDGKGYMVRYTFSE